jgi:phospholipase/carboxylesterase
MTPAPAANPHLDRLPWTAGASADEARIAAVLVHGRDQDPGFMLEVAERVALPDVAYVLPEASGRSWYPGRFFDPPAENEPWLTHALDACEAAIAQATAAMPFERVAVVGFSQGACLTAELVARRPRPFRAVAVLTGCLMGADEEIADPAPAPGLRIHFSTSRYDDWIPVAAVRETARRFDRAGARITLKVSGEREHHVSDDEADALRALLGEIS